DAAHGAADDLLPLAAVRRRVHYFRRSAEQSEPVGLDHRVDDERAAGLALAPATMAAVHEDRPAGHPVADGAAGAVTFERIARILRHCGQARNPRSAAPNTERLGNTAARSLDVAPNHRASVAPYCSTDVVGIQRPSFSES